MVNFNTIDLDHLSSVVRTAGNGSLSNNPALTLAQEGRVSVHWAPFDYTPSTARLVLVGITPGREQAENALRALQQNLMAGSSLPDALRHAKLTGSFSGPQMRNNIVGMLDCVGVNRALGVASCSSLFEPAHELVHFTSALRYPVFVDGANYNGTPDMVRTPLVLRMVDTLLAAEAQALPNALWLPLGPKPAAALRHLVSRGILPASRVLTGMPHPSGANAERIKFFLGLKPRDSLSAKTPPEPIENARQALMAQVAQLRGA